MITNGTSDTTSRHPGWEPFQLIEKWAENRSNMIDFFLWVWEEDKRSPEDCSSTLPQKKFIEKKSLLRRRLGKEEGGGPLGLTPTPLLRCEQHWSVFARSHTCTHTHTHAHAHTHTRTHTHTHTHTHAHAHTQTHTHAHAHTRKRTHTHTSFYSHTQKTLCNAYLAKHV